MGLDVIAAKDGEVVHDAELEELDVIRGMFTLVNPKTDAKGSGIRGKAYEQFLDDDASLSLYMELTPEQCRDVAAEFRAHAERLPEKLNGSDGDAWVRSDLEQAARWFEICADKGYGTVAWY